MIEANKAAGMPSDAEFTALSETMRRANGGDRAAIEELRRFLDANPQVFRRVGDLAQTAERAWIDLVAEGSVLASEAIQRQLAAVRQELMGNNPSAVIRMLADQVVATLLEVKYLETVSANAKPGTAKSELCLLKRLESAQRRHSAAIKTLEQTRKMLEADNVAPYLRLIAARATA
jgi:hypothetical protein